MRLFEMVAVNAYATLHVLIISRNDFQSEMEKFVWKQKLDGVLF